MGAFFLPEMKKRSDGREDAEGEIAFGGTSSPE